MLQGWQAAANGQRDLRIDWLRGLVMTFVIIDHSKLSSLLSWFTYERFWTVTAAEVFVVLSGVVLGMVYGRKLNRGDWRRVVHGLGHRALTLYLAFLAVTLSVVMLALAGIDVKSLTTFNDQVAGFVELIDPQRMGAAAWRDIALMRSGPWAFQIIGLYVWLVAAAVPCLFALRFIGWRPVLAMSWILYLWYRLAPHPLTTAQFEQTFPILAWQLLFVHGIVIGYHRERLGAIAARVPRFVPIAVVAASAAFIVFALCNPWTEGPGVLHWSLLSPERFTDLYFQYFTLTDLRIGRLLNLAVALPVGYALLTAGWRLASPLGVVFVTLGQQSLGAFVLHVYGILLVAHLPSVFTDGLWTSTLVQLTLILSIAVLLNGVQRWPLRRPAITTAPARPVTA
jgi:hypothetical protein